MSALCPGCKTTVSPNEILCRECGYDFVAARGTSQSWWVRPETILGCLLLVAPIGITWYTMTHLDIAGMTGMASVCFCLPMGVACCAMGIMRGNWFDCIVCALAVFASAWLYGLPFFLG